MAGLESVAASARKADEQDMWIVSYPRSGNTWLRYMLSGALSGERVSLSQMEKIVFDIYKTRRRIVDRRPPPRIYKSHAPFRPDYHRMVYLVRDPRDVALSYMNYRLGKNPGSGNLDSQAAFVEAFIRGEIDGFGSWREHVISWVATRGSIEEVLVVTYEDLVADAEVVLGGVLDHLRISPRVSIDEIVSSANRDRLAYLELEGDPGWRRTVGLQRGTFFGGADTSVRLVEALEQQHTDRIEAEFGDAMGLVGYS